MLFHVHSAKSQRTWQKLLQSHLKVYLYISFNLASLVDGRLGMSDMLACCMSAMLTCWEWIPLQVVTWQVLCDFQTAKHNYPKTRLLHYQTSFSNGSFWKIPAISWQRKNERQTLALCSLQVISGWISVLLLQKISAKSGRPPRIQKSLQKFLGKNSRLGTSSINSYSENDSFLCRRTVEPFKNLEWDIPKTIRGKWKNVRNWNRPKRWAKLKNFELEAQEPQNVGWFNGVF